MNSVTSKLSIFCGAFLASIVLGGVAEAANLSFSPIGSQLDEDPILDINIGPNQMIDFTININTAGLTKPIKSFSYLVKFDPSELKYPPLITGLISGSIYFDGTDTISILGTLNPDHEIPVNSSSNITTMRFTTVNPGVKPHDGMLDFQISKASGRYNDNTNIPNIFTYGPGPAPDAFSQQVEVQVPEPLTILGTATAVGFGAFFKRKLKSSKSTEKETKQVG